jgi:hypothetical protein
MAAIDNVSTADKEFKVQNWLRDRLAGVAPYDEQLGRNAYPDFVLLNDPVGFEVMSVQAGGAGDRFDRDFDANSHMPSGTYDGLAVFYVFLRYLLGAGTSQVHDLVICHGDFLNPSSGGYRHVNDHIPDFGGYGDALIRDRKMYVPRSPQHIAEGLAGRRTLILPAGWEPGNGLKPVGKVTRTEAERIACRYAFDLEAGRLTVEHRNNPTPARLIRSSRTGLSMVTTRLCHLQTDHRSAPRPRRSRRFQASPQSTAAGSSRGRGLSATVRVWRRGAGHPSCS